MYKEILDFLKLNDVKYKERIKLGSFSPIKIGGEADLVVYPESEASLISLISLLESAGIKYKTVGRMSNLLPPDEGYSGVVIRTDHFNELKIKNNCLSVFCGASLPHIAARLCELGLSGFEELSGIPGSIGGAIIGNAGAFGKEISDVLIDTRLYDVKDKQFIRLDSTECRFDYRSSNFGVDKFIILSADFKFCLSDSAQVKAKMREVADRRRGSQPIGYPSLGSTFKRPEKNTPAARLIDECGLKGHTVGGAQISEKHAGFIINIGGATSADYLRLANYAAQKVYECFGVRLEKEVEIL